MVVLDKVDKAKTLTLKQLSEENPEYINYITEAIGLLITENDLLRKIASRYSHDLRSPVTNIDMLLQLYEKADDSSDMQLYIQKMNKSVVRLQEGFEALSSERKNALVDKAQLRLTYLDEVLNEVKRNLPIGVNFITDFSGGKKIISDEQSLLRCFMLLVELYTNSGQTGEIHFSTEKTWEGLQLTIAYPNFIDLTEAYNKTIAQQEIKNKEKDSQLAGWNYYFALLFLRAMGAATNIDESSPIQTKVLISFTQ